MLSLLLWLLLRSLRYRNHRGELFLSVNAAADLPPKQIRFAPRENSHTERVYSHTKHPFDQPPAFDTLCTKYKLQFLITSKNYSLFYIYIYIYTEKNVLIKLRKKLNQNGIWWMRSNKIFDYQKMIITTLKKKISCCNKLDGKIWHSIFN